MMQIKSPGIGWFLWFGLGALKPVAEQVQEMIPIGYGHRYDIGQSRVYQFQRITLNVDVFSEER